MASPDIAAIEARLAPMVDENGHTACEIGTFVAHARMDIAALIARVRELERALHCDLCGASLLRGCISCGHIRDEEEI